MRFDDFAKAVAYYAKRSQNDRNYFPFLRRVQAGWHTPSVEVAECIVDFLNTWRMRIKKTGDLLDGIAGAVAEGHPYIEALRNLRIEESPLDQTLPVGTGRFYAVGNRFVKVATAKTLHLLAPGFFVIWDSSTCANLTPQRGSYAWRYAYCFLPRVQNDPRQLIRDTESRFSLGRQEAIHKLETLGKNRKTLAKLADEYYYSRFTRGLFRDKKGGGC